jgi:predicted DNA-binding transcriptional regulator YafY
MLRRDWFYQKARFEERDGAVVMSVPEIDPRTILPLVRWLGPDAELLSPEPLRHALAEEALRFASLYA